MSSLTSSVPSNRNTVPVARGNNPIRGLQNEINRLFEGTFGDLTLPAWDKFSDTFFPSAPAIDIQETDKAYTLTAELPGLDATDVQISASDGYLTFQGEKAREQEEKTKDFIRQERSFGSFRRIMPLPKDADFDAVDAQMKNGLLTVTVKRKADATTAARKIDIREVA